MNPNYLDFEQPIADLETKIRELRQASTGPAVNIDAEIRALENKMRLRTAQTFRDLTAWQVSQLALVVTLMVCCLPLNASSRSISRL